jgi:hypothetical protein
MRDLLRGDLVAHRLDRRRRRADEDHARRLQRGGEVAVFRQEAIARMHRLGPGLRRRLHDLVDHDIGLRGGRRADMHRLVRHLDMQRVAVGVGIDGDGRDAHLARGLDDAAGDLAPVGDQDLLEHGSPPDPPAGAGQLSSRLAGGRPISTPQVAYAGQAADGGAGKHVFIQRIGDQRAGGGTGDPREAGPACSPTAAG